MAKIIRKWVITDKTQKERIGKNRNDRRPQAQRLACVFLRLTERGQYAGIIEGDQNIYVVSDFRSDCQPKKNGWYLCLTPKENHKPLFISDGKPVYVVEILSAITSWKSSVNSRTIANSRSLSPNDLFGIEPVTLLFGERNNYFIRVIDSDERKRVAQELSRREKENTGFENLWTKSHGFIFSPNKIISSSLSEEDVIGIVFG